MKNFPHQINQLPRLNAALRIIADLIDAGESVDDQGVVGDALARSGVYTFRKATGSHIDALLASEHQKGIGSQGTRAAARDLRRFFRLLDFIRRNENDTWSVTTAGRALLRAATKGNSPRMRELWRKALLDIALEDAQRTSHPYQILLRLVAAVPGLPKPYSGLCLEAADDSPAEFSRILRIASEPNPAVTMIGLAGEHKARNSTKILPSLAVQLGDLVDRAGQLTIASPVADALFDPGRRQTAKLAIRNLVRRPFKPRRRSSNGKRRQSESGITTRRYDPDLIGARFNGHEDCLDRLNKLLPPDMERFEASYDLLVTANRKALLVEAKTIRNDERTQVRTAIGQLYYYQHFDVAPLFPDHLIMRVLLTDKRLADDVNEFLTACDIGVIWLPPDGKLGGTTIGLRQLKQFGV